MIREIAKNSDKYHVVDGILALNNAISQAQHHQLSLQHPDGYWWYSLEANESIGAEYIFLMTLLNKVDPERLAGLGARILSQQQSDGSWALYYNGPGDLSTTIECYFALKLAGVDSDSEPMRLAREFILSEGGIVKARVFTKIHLALFGIVPWSACPVMPIEFVLFHHKLPISIYEFSSWARACIVPLLVILYKKPVHDLPDNLKLDELFVAPPTAKCWRYELKQSLLSLENVFILLDSTLKKFKMPGLAISKKLALKRCENWIHEHVEKTEDIYPAMAYAGIAFHALGYDESHPVISRILKGLENFQQWYFGDDLAPLPYQPSGVLSSPANGDICHQQCCISPVWDTPWQMTALLRSGLESDHPALLKAARWLISKQVLHTYGDWSVKNRKARPGGWAFEFMNDYFPDVDDTIQVLMNLREVDLPHDEKKAAIERGLEWVLSMQCKKGGFAAFDVDNDLEILNKIPFSDHGACLDPPTPDITGRMIELLASYGYSQRDPAIMKAIAFIQREQHACGSWWGRWGVNHIYGTWCVLTGLRAIGENFDVPYIQRAVAWLKSVQRRDGGWGESPDGYLTGKYVPYPESTASQTAWACLGLIATRDDSPELRDGIEWLIRHQDDRGTWLEPYYTGTGFPGHFYIRYHGYRHFFPLLAISEYKRVFKK